VRAQAALLLGVLLAEGVWAGGPRGGLRNGSPVLEYLYIDAGGTAAAGGHGALRFDDEVYHFQYRAPGTLRLSRRRLRDLIHQYSTVENRSIRALRIDVSAETFATLRDYFDGRYREESTHFALLESLRDDRAFLEALLSSPTAAADDGRDSGPATPRIDAAGYFFPLGGAAADTCPTEAREADRPSAVARMRDRVVARRGTGYLEARQSALRDELQNLALRLPSVSAADRAWREASAPSYSLAARVRDLQQQLSALEVLDRALPLCRNAAWSSDAPTFQLDSGERDSLERLAQRLERALPALLDSARPDWGLPLLVGMARLEVVAASARSGRLLLLDSFREDAVLRDPEQVDAVADGLAAGLATARRNLHRARQEAFAGDTPRERDYAHLEAAANHFRELRQGLVARRPFHPFRPALWPRRGARRSGLPGPVWEPTALRGALERISESERGYERRLADLYRYELVTRNCVSEIFASIEAALAAGQGREPASGARTRLESTRQLGGHVSSRGSFNFIPFASARSVARSYRVSADRRLLSYRKARLQAMYAEESPLLVYLRESNTLTSTLYHRSTREPFFLFFTDDIVAVRPLYGALNLAAGLAEGLLGVLRAPFDRGATLRAGARGALLSLPELAFFNIRKGSMPHASLPRD